VPEEAEFIETPEMVEQREEVARILAIGLLRRIRLDRANAQVAGKASKATESEPTVGISATETD
jgi:hypothetical protein